MQSRKKNKLRLLSCLLFTLSLSACLPALDQNLAPGDFAPPRITGCYSNLSYHEESGDILGWEFFIVYSDDGYHVLFQESEGWPTVLMLLPVTVDDNTLSFIIPRAGGDSRFSGVISYSGLTGSFDNGVKIYLQRKNSYWQ